MKRILTISLLAAVGVWANIQSGNEQGLAEGHSFTSTGPGERVSNLNGNLLLSIPLADVTSASPLGIHLERSFNSHWRDPLYAAPMDFVAKDGNRFRTYRDDEFAGRSTRQASGFGGSLGEKQTIRSTWQNRNRLVFQCFLGIISGKWRFLSGLAGQRT
ncbi:MAG: hypothetical protein IPN71_17645 [Fibrobacteres bacterium]|nr:hypothetical protein [Fibrobacterota bacterium]